MPNCLLGVKAKKINGEKMNTYKSKIKFNSDDCEIKLIDLN